jgi:hydroxyethylthiazole kinase-like uncharacterized protein yjeF
VDTRAPERVEVVTPRLLRAWALPDPAGGKEARGQLLVVGGRREVPGAARLAGEAGLRAGAGKLAIATVRSVASALGVAVQEAAVLALDEDDDGNLAPSAAPRILERAGRAGAVLVGPGFGDPDASRALLEEVLPRVDVPVVVDAVASAYLTAHPDGLSHLDGRAVLTVNVSELAATAGLDDLDEDDVVGVAADLAARCGVVVLCGGEVKVAAAPDGRAWRVEGGTPGLGVSGSGDVQAGAVAGLLARGAEPAQAAVWGGYLHARAGERLAGAVGAIGFLARDLPPELPAVLTELA